MGPEALGEEAGEGREVGSDPAAEEGGEGGDGGGEVVDGDEAVEGLKEARALIGFLGFFNGVGHLREG